MSVIYVDHSQSRMRSYDLNIIVDKDDCQKLQSISAWWTCGNWSGAISRAFGAKRGLTQEQVEQKSGFSQQYLSGLERGQRNPTVVTLFELAQALGVNHFDLVAPDDQP